ncbi:MAG: NAD(P)/FAD-dependent oxidoreductase [Nostoc sp.]|uniref:FAD-dependent oxidoreductase n=1 Tax=Nostoc sp. TaxID=1180 RepID=UPI002FF51D90
MVKKVVIVGAGPCGLLLAHYLLSRGDKYEIDIYERRSDPRIVSFSTSRTYPISLNERAMRALRKIEGLEEAVKSKSLEVTGTIFHQKNGKTRVTPRNKSLFTLDRTSLAIVLLENLNQKYDNKLNLNFNCQCTSVDFVAKTVTLKKVVEASVVEGKHEFTVDYDLLIGADGANSQIRENFFATKNFECQQKYVPNDYKSIFLPRPNENSSINLEQGKIHSWIINDSTLIVLLHQQDGSMSGVVLFLRKKNQIVNLSNTEEVLTFFQNNFPEVYQMMPREEAEAFLTRPVSRILTIRCNRYHQSDNVLLMGDAAHAVSSSIGQGCNAALEDVVLFNNLLDEYSDNIGEVVEQFTVRRKEDAHALVELGDNAFPSTIVLFIEFVLRESIAKTLHKLFPHRFSPSISELIFETVVPYSEILNSYKGWISKVKKSNAKLSTNL